MWLFHNECLKFVVYTVCRITLTIVRTILFKVRTVELVVDNVMQYALLFANVVSY